MLAYFPALAERFSSIRPSIRMRAKSTAQANAFVGHLAQADLAAQKNRQILIWSSAEGDPVACNCFMRRRAKTLNNSSVQRRHDPDCFAGNGRVAIADIPFRPLKIGS